MNLLSKIEQNPDKLDIIHSKYPANNPTCRLTNGEGKRYNLLNVGDKVYIRKNKGINNFVVGEIKAYQTDALYGYKYEIIIHGKKYIRTQKDFMEF